MEKTDIESARSHGLDQAELAANNCGEDWKLEAFLAFKKYAENHVAFTTEDVRLSNNNIQTKGDPRAWGHIAQAAKKDGLIEFSGYMPVSSSNGSAKVLWKSLICANKDKD